MNARRGTSCLSRAWQAALITVAVAFLPSWLPCAPPCASAEVVRFGLFIGNNHGTAPELPLRYAVKDAERMREVLVEIGGFSPLNAVVLADPAADDARGALIAMNDRIRTIASRADTKVMLFVYYSGHADQRALHLGRSQFSLVELEQLVRGSAADIRVLLLDACGAGALTRRKGGKPAPPLPLHLDEVLEGEGVALVASNTASEDAQESDELRGSIFTHHFVSGLMGMADLNRDERVDLDEAYRYAYEATLRTTSRTWAGTQHPTFRFEISGSESIVLAELGRAHRRAALEFPHNRDYLVMRGSADGTVIAEVPAGRALRRISVRPDRYFVRGRASDHVVEGEVTVHAGETKRVGDDDLERIEYARLVRKGGSRVDSANGPLVGYSMRTEIADGGGLCHGMYAGYAFTLPALTLTPRLDACYSDFENASLQGSAYELGGELRIAYAWDLPIVTVEAGFAVGGSWLRQSFATEGSAPTRDSAAFRTGVGPSAIVPLGAGLYFAADLAVETYILKRLDTETGTGRIAPSVALRARAGIGKHW